MKKKPISAKINDDTHKALKLLAVGSDKTMTELVDEAISDLLEKYKKKINKIKSAQLD